MSPFEAVSIACLLIDKEIEGLPKGQSIYSHELYQCRTVLDSIKNALRPKPLRAQPRISQQPQPRQWIKIPEEKEQEVLNFIVIHKLEFDQSPTNAEIAQECGFTNRGVVSKLLKRMIDKGYITRQPGKARSLEVLNV
jgi:hypothetical protein